MKKFLVLYTGYGQGCDYTIDCNKTWAFIDASNMEEVIQKLMGDNPKNLSDEDLEDFEEYKYDNEYVWVRYGTRDERSYSDVKIYEINASFDLGNLCQKYQAALKGRQQEVKKKQNTDAERKEYERLKKKFGGK